MNIKTQDKAGIFLIIDSEKNSLVGANIRILLNKIASIIDNIAELVVAIIIIIKVLVKLLLHAAVTAVIVG